MNNQLLDKILGEFEGKFCETVFDKNGLHFIRTDDKPVEQKIPVMNKSDLKSFLTQALTTTYQAGQEDLKEKILEGIPAVHNEEDCELYIESKECEEIGYREEIIKLIEKL